jgi:hypothetical protein
MHAFSWIPLVAGQLPLEGRNELQWLEIAFIFGEKIQKNYLKNARYRAAR